MSEQRSFRDMAPVVVAGIVLSFVVYRAYQPWDLQHGPMIGAPFGRDFVNFWIGGMLAAHGQTEVLTDFARYNALIATTFGHLNNDSFIFSYPPTSLLILAPLGCLPYTVALSIWTAINLGALAAATRLLVGRRHWLAPAIVVCLSPASLMMVLYGHFGGLLGLATLVVVQNSERRPVLAGLCLAAIGMKPQYALMIGIVLLVSGRWRWLPAAALGTLALVFLSTTIFGAEIWTGFLSVTLPAQSRMVSDLDEGMLRTTTSVFLTARGLGLSTIVAWCLQAGVSLLAIVLAARALMRGGRLEAAFTVPLAALVALPYANHYDLSIVAPALTVLVWTSTGSSVAVLARLVAWLVPPLAWHLNQLHVPLLPIAKIAALVTTGLDRSKRQVEILDDAHFSFRTCEKNCCDCEVGML